LSKENFIVSLDIGTSQIRAIVAELEQIGTMQVVGVGTAPAKGIKKGAVIDIDYAVDSIRQAVEQAERMVGINISEVYVGVSGNHISLQSGRGVIAVSNEDREIGEQEIERVLQASKVVSLPPERAIIDVVPKQFIVDGQDQIHNPQGLVGVRLEVDSIIITGTKTILHNLTRAVQRAHLEVAGLVFLPMAISEFCLTEDEKHLGVVLADLGAGTISLAVYQQGHLAGTAMIPVGGEYITSDIAYGLRIQTEQAEEIKCKHGVAAKDFANKHITFDVKPIGSKKEQTVTQVDLAEIIEPRIAEMFYLIRQQVKALGFPDEPAGGYVLTGGVMETAQIAHVAHKYLGQAVRIASPEKIGVIGSSYLGGVSIIHYLCKRGLVQPSARTSRPKKKSAPSAFERVKAWISEFI
jgi:cell division protein FtsA